MNIKVIAKRILLGRNVKEDIHGDFNCSVCGMKNVGMNPLPMYYFSEAQKYGFIHNIFYTETINFKHYSCKNCGSSDRDRLYALFLEKYLKHKTDLYLLDIAPAQALATFIKSQPKIRYRSMDLMMTGVDDNLDITNMHLYNDEQFDFFICSHVLEHIPDDVKAMSELYRVLKKGGKGIVMVPINLKLELTLEDPTCTDIPTRWKLYGQDDHVRMYAKNDFINRLADAGFIIEPLGIDYFSEEVFTRSAIYPTSVLYIVNK